MTRKILAVLVMIMMLCGISWADIAYTTSDGGLGLIKFKSSTSVDVEGIKYQGSSTSPFVAPYWDGGSSRVILIDRTDDAATSGDTAQTFSPSDLSSPLETTPKTLTGIYGTRSAAGSVNGRALFLASGTKVTEFSTENFAQVHSYDCMANYGSNDVVPLVRDVMTNYYTIYILADSEDASMLLKFDGQLRRDVEDFSVTSLPHRSSSMSWLSRSRIALPHSEGIDILYSDTISTLSSDRPVVSVCADRDSGFYFITQTASGDATLSHYSYSTQQTTDLFTNEAGGNVQLLQETNYNVLGVIIGGKIRLYNMTDDSLVGEYSSSVLGGTPLNMAMTTATGEDSSNSSSGCDASGVGLCIAGLLAFMMTRKK
ncbi:MAG: hypothetical protein IJG65_07095 [Synergistaceae bacterium]|nr:hypothetical protein [Synergistaceae bacterium]